MLDDLIRFARPIVTAAVIPPVGFLWLALVGAVIIRRHLRLGRIFIALGLAGIYAFGTPIVSHALVAGLESGLPDAASEQGPPPGAIIILGGDGQQITGPIGSAVPGALSIQRLAGGATLARETALPILISGGTLGHGEPPISILMAKSMATAFALPVNWIEPRSANTCENAAFSAQILRGVGIESAWVVTHAWHMRRALLSFAQAGFTVRPAPLPAESFEAAGIYDFVPMASGWSRSYYAFHEWIGLLAYRSGVCRAIPS